MVLQPEGTTLRNYLQFSVFCSRTISQMFEKVDFVGKQEIVGSIFPDKLVFEEKKYRTGRITEALELISKIDKVSAVLK